MGFKLNNSINDQQQNNNPNLTKLCNEIPSITPMTPNRPIVNNSHDNATNSSTASTFSTPNTLTQRTDSFPSDHAYECGYTGYVEPSYKTMNRTQSSNTQGTKNLLIPPPNEQLFDKKQNIQMTKNMFLSPNIEEFEKNLANIIAEQNCIE